MHLLLASLLAPGALAGTLDGVTAPDTVTVGGQTLVLNGMGLREKFYIDVYVGSMYLPKATHSEREAIDPDVPKRIDMKFIYHEVTAEQIAETFKEGLAKNPNATSLAAKFDQLCAMMETVHAGDTIRIDYVPGTGTTFTVKGKVKGTIPGVDFMRAVWTIFVGPNPPTADLKNGLLGNG
jgi:hypothetical protein